MKNKQSKQQVLAFFGLLLLLSSCKNSGGKDGFYEYTNYNPDAPENNICYEDFVNPPKQARPQVWWHWLGGNVSKEGIRRDLEEMAAKGIGGARIFNVESRNKGPLLFNSGDWFDVFSYTVEEAARLGLEIGINNCDGFSEAGGPWITPDRSMKTLTWSLTRATGNGTKQEFELPQPASRMDYYGDIAVVAWPTSRPETLKMQHVLEDILPAGPQSAIPPLENCLLIFDGDVSTEACFSATKRDFDEFGVVFKFSEPVEVSSFYAEIQRADVEEPKEFYLEVSDDGIHFEKVLQLHFRMPTLYENFPARTGKYWRIIKYHDPNPSFWVTDGYIDVHYIVFKELELLAPGENSRSGSYIESLNAKAAKENYTGRLYYTDKQVPESSVVSAEHIQVFKDKLSESGKFEWEVPEGDWEIMRLGYTTTGKTNHPATEGGLGLEVDKFNAKHLDYHFDSYPKKMIEAAGKNAGSVFRYIETDSWECGAQNWTENFDEQFLKFNGYEFLPWLPVFTGEIVGSLDTTENFLRDFRRYTSWLVMENFYAQLTKRANEYGLLYSTEPCSNSYVLDAMTSYKIVDIPGNEIWQPYRVPGEIPVAGGGALLQEPVSAAHFYGKQFVSCESLTGYRGNWADSPLSLRGCIDRIMMNGFNQMLFHTYTHQPDERVPGWQMEPWGTALNRKITWWPLSESFFKYMSRIQYMMQKGKSGAKILYLYADEVPARSGAIEFPEGIEIHMINGDGVRHYLKTEDGKLVSPGRMKYDLLAMQPDRFYHLETLRKIKKLVQEGAVICGYFQEDYQTLAGGESSRKEWMELNAELFGEKEKKRHP